MLPLDGPDEPDGATEPPTAPVAELQPAADDRADVVPGQPAILVIEDDPTFAAVVLHVIRGEGFKGIVAGTGADGLELARRYRPSGIVLDVGLPDFDGWQVMEALKRDPDTRRIPVHFVTASPERERALRLGAVGFTPKPATAAQVRSALQALDHAARTGLRRVLLVESHAGVREALRGLLTGADLDVDVAESTGAAFDRLSGGSHACVVTDIAIPAKQDGFALIDRIRGDHRLAALPIVIHTGSELDAADVARLESDPRVIVVLEGVRSKERVLDETRLFVHRVRKSQTQPPPLISNGSQLEGKTVLIVDDDMRNVYSLSSALRANRLHVLTAADGREALDELERNPDTHAVLMDIMMPSLDGHEAMRRIRDQPRFEKLPIIALTARTAEGERERCLESGASDYLPKPIDLGRLVAVLRAHIH